MTSGLIGSAVMELMVTLGHISNSCVEVATH